MNKEFKKPSIIGDIGNMQFVLYDGVKTKPVFNAMAFNSSIGSYPILNKQNQVIEYMDLVGNFTKTPTEFAKEFSSYIDSRLSGVIFGYAGFITFYTRLLDFPSKYLTDNRIRKIVKDLEEFRYREACNKGEFATLLERLRYKMYFRNIYHKKVKKAERIKKQYKIQGRDIENIFKSTIDNFTL